LFWLVDTLCIPDCTCLQVEKHREDLLHKHAREMERLRDASVRLKEEYEHKMELERLFFLFLPHVCWLPFMVRYALVVDIDLSNIHYMVGCVAPW